MKRGLNCATTAILMLAAAVVLLAQVPAKKLEVVVTRAAGGSIQTKLSASIIVNKESSVTREWIALHDPNMPADLAGTPGVTTVYVPDRV